MDTENLRAYLERGWRDAEQLKREHWARERAERGPEVTLGASQALWHHMRLVNPAWPSEAERLDDLAHHIELKRAIDRAARVFIASAPR